MIIQKQQSPYTIFLLLLCVICFPSCKKYLDIPPPDSQIVEHLVYTDANTIDAAMNGLYEFAFGQGENANSFAIGRADPSLSLAADDASTNKANYLSFYQNTFSLNDTYIELLWQSPYSMIGRACGFIDGVNGAAAEVLSDDARHRYIAQAKIIRAYYYIMLTNLYGDVPLVISSDYLANSLLPRSPRPSVDSLIMADLLYARDMLPATGNDNYTFNQNTANALLSWMYGYSKNWVQEEAAASAVINSNRYQLVADLSTIYDRGSSEAIFQVPNAGTAYDGFILISSVATNAITSLSPSLINSFEPGDLRFATWVIPEGTNYKLNRYSSALTDPQERVIIRYADIILLRAEARAQQQKISDAITDLNVIRERAGLADLGDALDQQDVLNAMMKERRTELFVEGIYRWFDLNRWGILQQVMTAEKPTTWTKKAALFPIPSKELILDPHLTQNPGY